MEQYLNLLEKILSEGVKKNDRTGIGTKSIFGYQMRFCLKDGFPLVTTKEIHLKSVIYELLWFIRGETNIKYLQEHGVSIWNNWANEKGDLGPVYGKQWRGWPTYNHKSIDQLQNAIDLIRNSPESRRIIVSAWNVAQLEEMNLPPCHILFQFYVANGNLSCSVYQRSADSFIGLPFDIASFALLTTMIAKICDLFPGDLIYSIGDAHLYLNHLELAKKQLERIPYPLPSIIIHGNQSEINDFQYADFEIVNYKFWPRIKAPVAI